MNFQKLSFLFTSISLCIACRNKSANKEELSAQQQDYSGIYKEVNKGDPERNGCEIIVSYFDINLTKDDSSFLYHAFCHPNNFDPTGQNFEFKGFSVYGKCSKIDTATFDLTAYSGETIGIRINSDRSLVIFDSVGVPNSEGIYFYRTYLESVQKNRN